MMFGIILFDNIKEYGSTLYVGMVGADPESLKKRCQKCACKNLNVYYTFYVLLSYVIIHKTRFMVTSHLSRKQVY